MSFRCRQKLFGTLSTILLLAGACLPCSVSAQAGDYDHKVTITSPAEVAARRSQLIRYIWGTSSLPAGPPSRVVLNDNPPTSGLHHLARADTLEITMALGEKGYAHHLTPKRPNKKLIIYSEGHDDNFEGTHDGRMIDEILRNGYSVLLVYMPHMAYFTSKELGVVANSVFRNNPSILSHDQMFAKLSPASGSVLQFFLEPVAVSLNYLRQHWQNDGFPKYTDFGMAGLSGGGWATTVYAAIDPSIRVSVPIAGSLPRYLSSPSASGDAEQLVPGFYSIAGYLDLYLLGSYEPGRSQVQVLNRRDTCCFGEDQFYKANVTRKTSWSKAVRTYEREVRKRRPARGGRFRVEIDESATFHEVSLNTVIKRIVGEMNRSRRAS
ncbi:hypothetical protein [Steroidobacter cummioxidans]|uniref:hypothetical protein n=1 Tax=Steroidobacter cummioxidans TaxID=1803913 RepID=UPI0012907C2B|nr:hypothetical protein [Steroidobacter cummioxidans]